MVVGNLENLPFYFWGCGSAARNLCLVELQPDFLLTLKWSRGVPMDPKTPPFLDFYMLITPHLLVCVWKNRSERCAAIALGSLWTPSWPPTGRHSTKIIFHIHVTFDLWWLYINVDLWYFHISILIKINWCFINHLHSNSPIRNMLNYLIQS